VNHPSLHCLSPFFQVRVGTLRACAGAGAGAGALLLAVKCQSVKSRLSRARYWRPEPVRGTRSVTRNGDTGIKFDGSPDGGRDGIVGGRDGRGMATCAGSNSRGLGGT